MKFIWKEIKIKLNFKIKSIVKIYKLQNQLKNLLKLNKKLIYMVEIQNYYQYLKEFIKLFKNKNIIKNIIIK